jgi:hypothetical protein
MQLITSPGAVRGALMAATSTLLGLSPNSMAATWTADSTVLYYQESDDRVQAIEPVVNARGDFGNDRFLNIKAVIDTLSGASPNGASPSNVPQTFSRPSGKGGYTTAAGAIPLDSTFEDTRFAVSSNWEQPLDRMTRLNVGASVSAEQDYGSLGMNGAVARDINNKNTTLSAGAALSLDKIDPQGGTPDPFSAMAPPGSGNAGDEGEEEGEDDGEEGIGGFGGKSKTVFDVLLGVTQIIDRRTLMQLNYGLTYSSGYHEDPYKLLSVVDGNTGATQNYLYEKRPDTRLRNSVFWQVKHHLTRDVVDLTYRYYWDDWGISSHTVDLRYRWQFASKHYLEPHARYYTQAAADFYHHSLVANRPLPDYASADYRLAEFDAVTLGLKYGLRLHNDDEVSVRFEIYRQTGVARPDDAIGIQRNYDMYPDMTAVIAQVSYSFR